MISLPALKNALDHVDQNEVIDDDVKTSIKWDVLNDWAKDLIRLDENIKKTHLNHEDRLKQLKVILDKIKPT